MSLAQKTIRFAAILALLFGMGGFSAATGAANHHGAHAAAKNIETHAAAHDHSSHADHGGMPSETAPDSDFGCCHSLACTTTAVFPANAALFTDDAGNTIPLVSMTVAQGQPISPSKRPPKRYA
ncbi:MAG: hypothetical protein RIB59_05230 [Rhodospirillales bacterium]